jgi:hypothetical protein
MANELTLSVNGAKQVVSATPDTALLFVLRNELKLTGPRLGCGMAQCGACSVLLDGEEVRACITPISYAVGKQVTTIEGLPAVWAMQLERTRCRRNPASRPRKGQRYGSELRRQAVERMNACGNIVGLARELGVSRRVLYQWRDRMEQTDSSPGGLAS